MPPAPDRGKQERGAQAFPRARLLPVSGYGPEDVVVDDEGRLLSGVEDGRILRIDPHSGAEETVGETGGRPLGLEMLADGRLLVCDAHKGLLRLDPASGEIETLVQTADGEPLRFCSNATAASDGTIWFTESSTRFGFEQFLGSFLEHRPSGRLMRRDADGSVEVALSDLYFANGVTLTEDESALVFAETAGPRLSRMATTGPRAGEAEVIADNMPGYPDNLSRARDGRFWVPLTNPREGLLDRLGTAPGLLRELVWRIPDRLRPQGKRTTWVMAFDESGRLLADLQEPREDFHMATGVAEHEGRLYLASVEERALLELDLEEHV